MADDSELNQQIITNIIQKKGNGTEKRHPVFLHNECTK